jgi:hypothetical protein
MKDLTRSTLLAVPLALLMYGTVLRHQGSLAWDLLDAFTLAFSFTYVGHWVEVLLLKIPGIDTPTGKVIRVVGWFAGGLWCYELARWLLLLYGRSTAELPPLLWGGLFFVGLEFVVHALLQMSGRPNFYSGQLQATSV